MDKLFGNVLMWFNVFLVCTGIEATNTKHRHSYESSKSCTVVNQGAPTASYVQVLGMRAISRSGRDGPAPVNHFCLYYIIYLRSSLGSIRRAWPSYATNCPHVRLRIILDVSKTPVKRFYFHYKLQNLQTHSRKIS